MLESQSRAIRREKWTSVPIGIYLILFSTAFFLLAAFSKSFEQRLWFALCALFIALIWVPIVLRYHIIRFRLEMMKEIKETQWRIAEIADSLPGKK
ncbi:MAG: hypothetical protein LAO31_07345 [Acidobacteriia bacterium]|nr:hypothetical protein [Terriglobia bacterium]